MTSVRPLLFDRPTIIIIIHLSGIIIHLSENYYSSIFLLLMMFSHLNFIIHHLPKLEPIYMTDLKNRFGHILLLWTHFCYACEMENFL
jgi:hypothetical protein